MIKKLKELLCNHKEQETVTNLYGDVIQYYSTGNKIIRSVRKCVKCGKLIDSEYLDNNCNIVNFKKIKK